MQAGSLKLGERVLVRTLNSEGILTAIGESDAEVQIGTLRVRARFSDLERLRPPAAIETAKPARKQAEPEPEPKSAARKLPIASSPGMEVNLRGKLVEDGLVELDRYLERAYAAGLPFVRIVHGKGTGRMREAVREALKDSPLVSSFEEAEENEGGAGVTIAHMGGR
jgi:DNA mismatch repair protein MutS2